MSKKETVKELTIIITKWFLFASSKFQTWEQKISRPGIKNIIARNRSKNLKNFRKKNNNFYIYLYIL